MNVTIKIYENIAGGFTFSITNFNFKTMPIPDFVRQGGTTIGSDRNIFIVEKNFSQIRLRKYL